MEYDPKAADEQAKAKEAAAKERASEAAAAAVKPQRSFSSHDLWSVSEEASGVDPVEQPISLHQAIKRQVKDYLAEAAVGADTSTLEWWKKSESRFWWPRKVRVSKGGVIELGRSFFGAS